MTTKHAALLVGLAALAALPALAQRQKDACMESTRASLTPATVKPGGKTTLTLTIEMKDDYHIYDPNPGDKMAIPTTFQPFSAPGVTYGKPVFPKPHVIKGQRVHEGVVVIKVPVTLAKTVKAGAGLNIGGALKVQACNATGCLPPFTLKLSAPLKVGK